MPKLNTYMRLGGGGLNADGFMVSVLQVGTHSNATDYSRVKSWLT